jgi:hypothetical protein
MPQATQGFIPLQLQPPSLYQGNPQQQQGAAALASSSLSMEGDSITSTDVGIGAATLLGLGAGGIAVAHFATSTDKPKPAQTTSPTSKPGKGTHTPPFEPTPVSIEGISRFQSAPSTPPSKSAPFHHQSTRHPQSVPSYQPVPFPLSQRTQPPPPSPPLDPALESTEEIPSLPPPQRESTPVSAEEISPPCTPDRQFIRPLQQSPESPPTSTEEIAQPLSSSQRDSMLDLGEEIARPLPEKAQTPQAEPMSRSAEEVSLPLFAPSPLALWHSQQTPRPKPVPTPPPTPPLQATAPPQRELTPQLLVAERSTPLQRQVANSDVVAGSPVNTPPASRPRQKPLNAEPRFTSVGEQHLNSESTSDDSQHPKITDPIATQSPITPLEEESLVREIHYYPQRHYIIDHGKYKPEIAFLHQRITDDLLSKKAEDIFPESFTELDGEIQEFYRKRAESAFNEYEPGKNLTEPQKVALGGGGSGFTYPYMPAIKWSVQTHQTESESLYKEAEVVDNRYWDGKKRYDDGLRDGTNNGPSKQDVDRLESERKKVVFEDREEFFANALRDFFKNNPTKKRAFAIMGSAHVNLPALIEKKIPGAKVIKHDFLTPSPEPWAFGGAGSAGTSRPAPDPGDLPPVAAPIIMFPDSRQSNSNTAAGPSGPASPSNTSGLPPLSYNNFPSAETELRPDPLESLLRKRNHDKVVKLVKKVGKIGKEVGKEVFHQATSHAFENRGDRFLDVLDRERNHPNLPLR